MDVTINGIRGGMEMDLIGLFCPAMVSVLIKNRKGAEADWRMPEILFRYGIYVLVNVFLTGCIITYGLGIPGVTVDALSSFPFFIKYMLIALVAAVMVPYAEEIIRKYIEVTVTVRAYDEKGKDYMEDHQ
jgi:membrane protease YdiL (CAAX protease family)